MRRPNRSIEVFDISLMAVVTKAMGAFLVLMVVFMQYYSSGPLGKQTAADLAQSIERTQSDLTDAMKKLVEKASPDEIAKLLEEARRRLDEAKRMIDQLRRENDALNSQAQRLQNENQQLQKQVEEMQRKLDAQKIVVSGNMVNWDCLDVRLQMGLVTPEMFVELKDKKDPYILNYGVSLGAPDATDDTEIVKANPKAASLAPGESFRFNNSSFRLATDPATLTLIVVKQRPQLQTVRGGPGRLLSRSKQDCSILLSLQSHDPGKNRLLGDFTRKIMLPKDDYATVIFDLAIGGKDMMLKTVDTPRKMLDWVSDQVAHAEKVSP